LKAPYYTDDIAAPLAASSHQTMDAEDMNVDLSEDLGWLLVYRLR
jgi:hypothetical protein